MSRFARIIVSLVFCAALVFGLVALEWSLRDKSSFSDLILKSSAFSVLLVVTGMLIKKWPTDKVGPLSYSVAGGLFYFLFGVISDLPRIRPNLPRNIVFATVVAAGVFFFAKWGPSTRKVQTIFSGESESRNSLP